MSSMNRVFLIGNLTKDPELRHAPSGSAVAELRLAVSETYRDRQTNQPKEITCFVDVVAWERQAELCQQYLAKGRSVLVEGRLQYDEWKNPQGEKRSRMRVRADRIQFLSPKPPDGSTGAAAPQPPRAAAATSATPAAAAGSNPVPSTEDSTDFAPDGAASDDDNLPF